MGDSIMKCIFFRYATCGFHESNRKTYHLKIDIYQVRCSNEKLVPLKNCHHIVLAVPAHIDLVLARLLLGNHLFPESDKFFLRGLDGGCQQWEVGIEMTAVCRLLLLPVCAEPWLLISYNVKSSPRPMIHRNPCRIPLTPAPVPCPSGHGSSTVRGASWEHCIFRWPSSHTCVSASPSRRSWLCHPKLENQKEIGPFVLDFLALYITITLRICTLTC